MSFKIKFLFLFALFFPSLLSSFEDPFEWVADLPEKNLVAGEDFLVEVTFQIPQGHFLYKEKTKIMVPPDGLARLSSLETSASLLKEDPFFGKEVEVFEGGATLRAHLRLSKEVLPGEITIPLEIRYQGCSQTLCFREMRHPFPVSVTIRSGQPKEAPAEGGSLVWRILLAFFGGLLTDLTPCVLPIIPITLAFIGVSRQGSFSRNLGLTLVLVLTMALTYAGLGVLAASFGKNLGFLFQGALFSLTVAILYLFFALALLGWVPFQVPASVRNQMARWGGRGFLGSALAGVTIGFLAAPCVGPVIASILVYVAQSGEMKTGFLLLFSFGLGMGSLFFLMGGFYHFFAGRSWGGGVTLWIKRILAVLLILPALYYGYVAFQQIRIPSSLPEIKETSFWMQDPKTAFARAEEAKRPIFVDFFATWCLPCLEMERKTFSKEEVQKFLQENFIPLKVDCTVETKACKEMIEKYQVVGWPTYLILNSKGEVLESVVGKILEPKQLLLLAKKYTSP